jgi:hypothetical protein
VERYQTIFFLCVWKTKNERLGGGGGRRIVFYVDSRRGAFDRSCRDTTLAASCTAFRLNNGRAVLCGFHAGSFYVTKGSTITIERKLCIGLGCHIGQSCALVFFKFALFKHRCRRKTNTTMSVEETIAAERYQVPLHLWKYQTKDLSK